MKKKLNFIFVITLCFLALTGCMENTNKDKDLLDLDNDEGTTEQKENKIEKAYDKAKKDIEEKSEIAKEDVEKAYAYIDENINDPFKEEDVTEKLAYYSAYLKLAGEKITDGTKHELATLGGNVHNYLKGIYNKTEKETGKISTDLKKNIHNSLDTIRDKKDDIVDDFHKGINNIKNTITE